MKKVLSVIIVFVMVITMLPAGLIVASALTSGDYTYTVANSEATITAYSGSGGDITIPDNLDGYPVTAIGESAFIGNDGTNKPPLTSVIIPYGVTSIGDNAFFYCMYLNSVNIPGSVTLIGFKTFSYCCSLAVIDIPDSVRVIEDFAFFGCMSLTSITIPDGVIEIGEQAFGGCYFLTKISIPKSVAIIRRGVFTGCDNLTQIIVDPDNQYYSSDDNVLFNKAKTILIQYPGGKSGSYIIPDGVTEINGLAFGYFTGLTSVVFPDSLTTIRDSAFIETGLTSVTIPASVTTIESRAFADCTGLVSAYFLGNNPLDDEYYGFGPFKNAASGFKMYYILTFDANGGTGGTSGFMAFWAAISAPAVTKTGYTFTGWDNEISSTMPKNKTTYTALWGINKYTVIFDANGGIGGTNSLMRYGEAITAPVITRAGYIFTGWSAAVPETVGAENATYTALWGMIGDLNTDVNIDTLDALMVLRSASGKITLTDAQKLVADINKDSETDSLDALMILRFASGKIISF